VPPDLGERHPLQILLAEDNAVNQKLALKLLERMSYQADIANNGLEAVERVAANEYDVVLMDVQMPEMDGLEATRQIIAAHGDRRPRIVALTADAMAEDRERCLAAGMDDYLTKPIRPAELAQALERVTTAPEPVELDEAAIASLLASAGGDGEFVVSLLEEFESAVQAMLAELHTAAEAHDCETLRRAAHTLKSNAATFGASDLSGLCAELEAQARDNGTDGTSARVSAIERAYASAQPALAALHARLSG
jgi:CheY-like chemotaxis protein/HPt (histidine-containing phosphotransfer) domain-containing protein